MWRFSIACTGLALALMCSCNKSTEVLVVVSTDLVMPAEADALQLDVTRVSDGVPIFSQTYPLTSPDSLPASLDLHGSKSAPTFALRAQLLHHGVSIVERRVVMPFDPGRALELRVPLERSCIASACSGDTTCVGGQCVPVTVKPADLPSIGPDPLAPADLASSASADLTPALDQSPAADLLAPPDLATVCGMQSVPSMMTGCKNYDFSLGKIPTELTLHVPSDVTYDFVCNNLNLHIPAGSHVYPNDVRIFIANESNTAQFSLVAQYDVEAHGVSWVGVGARANEVFVRGETRPNVPSAMGDLLFFHNSASSSTNDGQKATDSNFLKHHHVALERVFLSAMSVSTYSYIADSAQALTANLGTVPLGMTREFSVGNDQPAVAGNAIDVHLQYLQFCNL